MDKKESTSVKSPTDGTSGLIKNAAGSMPPKMDFAAIQKENSPPKTYAKDSTDGAGHLSS